MLFLDISNRPNMLGELFGIDYRPQLAYKTTTFKHFCLTEQCIAAVFSNPQNAMQCSLRGQALLVFNYIPAKLGCSY
jgi:hypothetical protein